MITFQRERVHDLWAEIMPLFDQHWHEVAFYKDVPLAPDTLTYERAEDSGMLRCYTARRDGALVGYAFFFVRGHLHYVTTMTAMQDLLFLISEERRGGAGKRLIQWCDEQLRAEGVQVVTHHVKVAPGLDFGSLLARLGYEPTDMLWSRRLDR